MSSPALRLPPSGGAPHRHPGFLSRGQRLWPCQLRDPAGGEPRTGWVHHLSSRGLALFVDCQLPPDRTFEVLLLNPQATFSLRQPLTIRRCDRLAGGSWFAAGAFPEALRPEQIRPFLT